MQCFDHSSIMSEPASEVRAGLWSDTERRGDCVIERPHAGTAYARRAAGGAILEACRALPRFFIPPRPAALGAEARFIFDIPSSYGFGRELAPAHQDRGLSETSLALAVLHAVPESVWRPVSQLPPPPMYAIMRLLAERESHDAVAGALGPVRPMVRKAVDDLSAPARTLCHGRWSLGVFAYDPAAQDRMCAVVGPDLFVGPPEADLGYLMGDLVEAIVSAKLTRNTEAMRCRINDALAMVNAYQTCSPLCVEMTLNFAAARVAAHFAANERLRRKRGEQAPFTTAALTEIFSHVRATTQSLSEILHSTPAPPLGGSVRP